MLWQEHFWRWFAGRLLLLFPIVMCTCKWTAVILAFHPIIGPKALHKSLHSHTLTHQSWIKDFSKHIMLLVGSNSQLRYKYYLSGSLSNTHTHWKHAIWWWNQILFRETDRQSVRHTDRWQFSRLQQVCDQMVSCIFVCLEPHICADSKIDIKSCLSI